MLADLQTPQPTLTGTEPTLMRVGAGAAPERTLCLLPGGVPRRPRPVAELAPPFAGWRRYLEVELLGEGGMAQVYRAFDPLRRRRVALKFPRRRDGEPVPREARLQTRAAGPHVPRVYETGALAGHPYFAMELIDAPTLKLARRQMSFDERLVTAAALSRALDAVHEAGLIHRDLNPRNVLVRRTAGPGWWPLLIDFGIACELSGAAPPPEAEPVVGTASYMAPEQALGRAELLGRQTDVYSLGATLYELFAGRRPFAAESSQAILTKALHDDPEPLAAVAPGLPAELGEIVGRCLDKRPEARFPTANAVAEGLERCRRRTCSARSASC